MTTFQLQPRQIALIQSSWASVAPIADAAATMFYERLFVLDPSVKPLFTSDFEQQKKKLLQSLSTLVNGLQKPQMIIPVLEKLGERHVGFRVEEKHYKTVGEALLWTLQEGIGDGFTPEVAAAWTELYGFASATMIRAAKRAMAGTMLSVPDTMLTKLEAKSNKESAAELSEQTTEVRSKVSEVAISVQPVMLPVTISASPELLAVLGKTQPVGVGQPAVPRGLVAFGVLGGGGSLVLSAAPVASGMSTGNLLIFVVSLLALLSSSFVLGFYYQQGSHGSR